MKTTDTSQAASDTPRTPKPVHFILPDEQCTRLELPERERAVADAIEGQVIFLLTAMQQALICGESTISLTNGELRLSETTESLRVLWVQRDGRAKMQLVLYFDGACTFSAPNAIVAKYFPTTRDFVATLPGFELGHLLRALRNVSGFFAPSRAPNVSVSGESTPTKS